MKAAGGGIALGRIVTLGGDLDEGVAGARHHRVHVVGEATAKHRVRRVDDVAHVQAVGAAGGDHLLPGLRLEGDDRAVGGAVRDRQPAAGRDRVDRHAGPDDQIDHRAMPVTGP